MPLLTRNKPEVQTPVIDLTARLSRLRADVESTRRELAAERADADRQNTDAILHGGLFDPTLGSKAEALSAKLQTLEAELQPLQRAVEKQRIEAAEVARVAEIERVAKLKGEYREAVRGILNSIRAVERTQLAADAIYRQFPAFSTARAIAFPGVDTEAGQFFRSREEQLCRQGFADLFEPSDIARVRFEHEEAEEARFRERFAQQQRINQANAGALEEEERQEIPNRTPRQSKAGALVA